MVDIISESEAQTKALGRRFSKILKKGDIVLLEGQLGGGKTTFIKGLAKGFGYLGHVLSPSFTLAREYRVKKTNIYHLDLYRLKQSDLSSIDIEDYLYDQQGVCLVEWGKKLEFFLERYLKVSFIFLGINKRKLLISQKGYSQSKLKF